MKTGYWVLFVVLVIGMNSCMWGVPHNQAAAVTKDTLSFTYEYIKKSSPGCPGKPDSGCAMVEIKYPVFKNAELLNDSIIKKIIRISGNDSVNRISDVTKDFLKSYNDFKDDTSSAKVTFSLDEDAIVLRQDSSLITIQLEAYQDSGGAHGSTYISFINWNRDANRNMILNDILKSGCEKKLTKAGEKIFRKNEKLADNASLEDDYFFNDGKFVLPNNFLLTPLGIRFLYNDYEIKPYAAGQTDLLIPYAQIKTLLRPNTVITQYIK